AGREAAGPHAPVRHHRQPALHRARQDAAREKRDEAAQESAQGERAQIALDRRPAGPQPAADIHLARAGEDAVSRRPWRQEAFHLPNLHVAAGSAVALAEQLHGAGLAERLLASRAEILRFDGRMVATEIRHGFTSRGKPADRSSALRFAARPPDSSSGPLTSAGFAMELADHLDLPHDVPVEF